MKLNFVLNLYLPVSTISILLLSLIINSKIKLAPQIFNLIVKSSKIYFFFTKQECYFKVFISFSYIDKFRRKKMHKIMIYELKTLLFQPFQFCHFNQNYIFINFNLTQIQFN